MSEYQRIRAEVQDDVTIVRLVDPKMLDSLDVGELAEELLRYIQAGKPARLIVSFETVTRCSTAVINGLLAARKALAAHQGELLLCEMRDAIHDAFKIVKLDFVIHDTLHEAVDAARAS